jgi:hypothetical protein
MYVCMYVCLHVMHVYVYIYMLCVCIYMYALTYMYVCMYVCKEKGKIHRVPYALINRHFDSEEDNTEMKCSD